MEIIDVDINKLTSVLNEFFQKKIDKRVVVLATTCTGKSTIIKDLSIGRDMDEEIFPLLSQDEKDYVCQYPWNEEIGKYMDTLVRDRLSVKKGIPLFGTVYVECDIVIFIKLDKNILRQRCLKRNVNFENAINMQIQIENEICNILVECICLNVKK